MIPYDPLAGYGITEFTPSVVDKAARLQFAGLVPHPDQDNDSGLLIYPVPFVDTVAELLVKYSTNPALAATVGDSEINAGLLLRVNLETLSAYIVVLDDRGYLQLQKLTAGNVESLCPPSSTIDVENFDPADDWWVRAECKTTATSALVRAKAWRKNTPEPAEWTIACEDPGTPFPAGLVAVVANEDGDIPGNFIDVDDVAAGKLPERNCVNGQDDDGDGAIDCHDSDCAELTACSCNDPFADVDGDSDVDHDDFGIFQRCLFNLVETAECDCLDREYKPDNTWFDPAEDGDGDVDLDDFTKFEACVSGPAVPADKACDD